MTWWDEDFCSVHHVLIFVAQYQACMLHTHNHGSYVWDVSLHYVCMSVGWWEILLKDEQECRVEDQMGWGGKGSMKEEEEIEMEAWEGEEVIKKNGKGWQMVTLNNEDGGLAMSSITANQNKWFIQKDVLLEACALTDTCMNCMHKSTYTRMQIPDMQTTLLCKSHTAKKLLDDLYLKKDKSCLKKI